MTRKHFTALADAMRRARPNPFNELDHKQWERDVQHIAHFCQGQSPNFNHDRFIAYAKGECSANGYPTKPVES